MTNDQTQRRVVLIYGDPGQGKSYLAEKLVSEYVYNRVGLDDEYVKFIQKDYGELCFSLMSKVISLHYEILMHLERRGDIQIAVGASKAWEDRVARLAENASRDHELVVVEGFLLWPALDAVVKKLADTAVVTVVEARNSQYYVRLRWIDEQIHANQLDVPWTIEQIHGSRDA